MWEYAITQTKDNTFFMAGLKDTANHVGVYLGEGDTLTQTFALIAVHAKTIGLSEAFTVEYIPWKD